MSSRNDGRVGLWYNYQNTHSGPGKVVQNLTKGLTSLGVEVLANTETELNGCLQGGCPRYQDLPPETLMGPNLFLTPKDEPGTMARYRSFVCPSEWVRNYYLGYGNEEVVKGKEIDIWSVGIDTQVFNTDTRAPECDCLLYVKNRSSSDLASVEAALTALNVSGVVMAYGSYTQEEFLEVGKRCRAAVLVTNTESQGIAYMELMAMGLPCYVYDQTVWENMCPATSAPYHTERCGIKVQGLDHSRLVEFWDSVSSYDPAGYIRDYHTVEHSAQKYLDLLKRSHARQT